MIEQKKKVGFVPSNNGVGNEKKQQTSLDDFLKGTISGEELVKYVCNKLDEKYSIIN